MKKILAICNNPDESRGHYTMLSKSDRERQILYDLTHIYNLKKKKKPTNKNRFTNTENKWLPEGWDVGAKR